MQQELGEKTEIESFEYPKHLYPEKKGLAKAFQLARNFGHSDAVNSVAVSHQGDLIVSASNDKTLKVWDFSSGNLLRTIEAHSKEILSVVISKDDSYIISGSSDNSIKVWGLRRGNLIHHLKEHKDEVTCLA
ncbi:MAG: WD40 repeat domain-containing protein, partial [Promethearchaeota archaeon]